MDDPFRKIYHAFDPAPLREGQESLRVELDEFRDSEKGVANQLARRIRYAERVTHHAITGHKGSGKTTELYHLKRLLQSPPGGESKFFTVLIESKHSVDLGDVDFMDILVLVIQRLAEEMKNREGIRLEPSYFRARWERLKGLLGSVIEFDGIELDIGLMKINGALKTSPDARRKLYELFEPDAHNWLQAANDVLGEALRELERRDYGGLVIIVDDLDKIIYRRITEDKTVDGNDELHRVVKQQDPMTVAERLFVYRAPQLTAFKCHMVYSIPLDLAYSHHEQNLKEAYGGGIPVIPMTKVWLRPPEEGLNTEGVEKFREIIRRRLAQANANEGDLFAPDRNELSAELIRISGGDPFQLMFMIRESMIDAGLPIKREAIEHAKVKGRREFSLQMREEYVSILNRVRTTGRIPHSNENEHARVSASAMPSMRLVRKRR